jgi:hypothetical protein
MERTRSVLVIPRTRHYPGYLSESNPYGVFFGLCELGVLCVMFFFLEFHSCQGVRS